MIISPAIIAALCLGATFVGTAACLAVAIKKNFILPMHRSPSPQKNPVREGKNVHYYVHDHTDTKNPIEIAR